MTDMLKQALENQSKFVSYLQAWLAVETDAATVEILGMRTRGGITNAKKRNGPVPVKWINAIETWAESIELDIPPRVREKALELVRRCREVMDRARFESARDDQPVQWNLAGEGDYITVRPIFEDLLPASQRDLLDNQHIVLPRQLFPGLSSHPDDALKSMPIGGDFKGHAYLGILPGARVVVDTNSRYFPSDCLTWRVVMSGAAFLLRLVARGNLAKKVAEILGEAPKLLGDFLVAFDLSEEAEMPHDAASLRRVASFLPQSTVVIGEPILALTPFPVSEPVPAFIDS